MLRLLTSIIIAAFVVGCAAIGPIDAPEFPSKVAKAVPSSEGEIHLYGPGNWYPNSRGFTGLRSSLLASPSDPIPGVLVVTKTSVLFQQWDEVTNEFDVVKRFPFAELLAASLDSFGLNRRIVLRKKDLSYDSFDFTQASGKFFDARKVEEAVAFVRDRIKP